MQIHARRLFPFTTVTMRATLALMLVAWLVPFLVHSVPWAGPRPLGAHLLPAFWTALVAVYLHGGRIGLLIALVVPVANLLTTGLPVPERLALMTLELAGFVAFCAVLFHRWPSLRWAAPVAWLAAKAVTIGVQWAVPSFAYTRDPVNHFLASTMGALGGLGVLLALNIALVTLLPKDDDWDSR